MVVFLSVFILIDKDKIMAFFLRLAPPRYAGEVRLLQTSVSSSFGGFMRGQAIQGVVLGLVAAAGGFVLDIDYWPAAAVIAGLLQMLPFFGPFVSWAPPVVVAALTGSPVLPILLVMIVGWFVVMNIIQPRVMANSVGIHPVMVLVSVLIGLKLQGVVGAIFAVPVAAVISAFFFFYLERSPSGGPRDVASRAARRVEEREGRSVRVPTAPVVVPGSPADAASLSVSGGAAAVAPTAARGGLTGAGEPLRARGGGTGPASSGDAARRHPGVTDEVAPGRSSARTPGSRSAPRRAGMASATRPGWSVARSTATAASRSPSATGGCRRRVPRIHEARPLGRVADPAADPGHQRRRHRVPRAARAQAGARAHRRRLRRRPRDQPVGGRPPEDVHAPAPGPGADCSPTAASAGPWTGRRPMP